MALFARIVKGRATDVPLPAEPVAVTEPVSDAPATGDVLSLVEEDIGRSRSQIGQANAAMAATIDESAKGVAAIVTDAEALADAVGSAVSTVEALGRTFEAIASAGTGIGKEIDGATSLAATAQSGAERAGTDLADLQSAISRIESVVGLIAKVAKQTNLLALNATIEAERAGAAGKGFAVVAQEVKALSVETQRATDEISRTIGSLQTAARQTITTVGDVSGLITSITPRFAAVADAVGAQASMIATAADLATETRTFIEGVADRAGHMKEQSAAIAAGVSHVRGAADALTATSDRSMARLTTVLRQTPEGDRRRHDRFPATLPVEVSAGTGGGRSETVDISEGGLLLKPAGLTLLPGATADLSIEGIGRIRGRVVGASSLGYHVAFGEMEPSIREALLRRIGAIKGGYQQLIDRATQTADQIGHLFEQAVASGRISEADLFDTDYQPIDGTRPRQFRTRGLELLEHLLPPIQEALLAGDGRMVFCAAVDRNGYLPVHNLVFSKPQRPDDEAWNTANCRNRRIFDDRTGLLAARNTRPFVVQAYSREMGNGVTVLMKEVDAPIAVGGRHWGGFRTAYKL